MQDVVDALAHEYGWSKRQILEEVYPDELPLYLERIARRRREEAIKDIDEWLLRLQIYSAPHTKGGGRTLSKIARGLQSQRRALEGVGKPDTVDARISEYFARQVEALREVPGDADSQAPAIPHHGDE